MSTVLLVCRAVHLRRVCCLVRVLVRVTFTAIGNRGCEVVVGEKTTTLAQSVYCKGCDVPQCIGRQRLTLWLGGAGVVGRPHTTMSWLVQLCPFNSGTGLIFSTGWPLQSCHAPSMVLRIDGVLPFVSLYHSRRAATMQ